MGTKRPLSTITYNSPKYLVAVLEALHTKGHISFWAFIPHKGEDLDESGSKKDHIHVYMEPVKNIDPEDLRKRFNEPDPKHPTKPLGAMTIKLSKFDDWYKYVRHLPEYLQKKGLQKKYSYTDDRFCTSDTAEFRSRVAFANLEDPNGADYIDKRLLECAKSNIPWNRVLLLHIFPYNKANYYERSYFALSSAMTVGADVENLAPLTEDSEIDPTCEASTIISQDLAEWIFSAESEEDNDD